MTLSHTRCWAIIKKAKEGDSDMMCSVTFKTVRWLINEWRNKMWWICLIWAALVVSCDTQITSETTLWSQSPDRSVVTPWLGKHHAKGMSAPRWSEMEPSGCKTPVPTFLTFFFSNQHVKNKVSCCCKICIYGPCLKNYINVYILIQSFIHSMKWMNEETDWHSFNASGCLSLCVALR